MGIVARSLEVVSAAEDALRLVEVYEPPASPIGRWFLLCDNDDAATGKDTASILRLVHVLGTAMTVALRGSLFVVFRRERMQRRLKVGWEENASQDHSFDRPNLLR